jgi:hypothetical protein
MDGVNRVEHRIEQAVFETDRYRIVGDVTLPPEGYQSRFSDLLNRDDLAFIPLTNAQIAPLEGGEVERRRFLALGKVHVRIAYPLQESV